MKKIYNIGVLSSLMLVLCVSLAHASAAQYRVAISVEDRNTQAPLGSATCLIDQTLEWGNMQSIWSCRFNKDENPKVAMLKADTIGYSYDERAAFVEFTLSSESKLGKYLLSGLGMQDRILEGTNKLNHTYFNSNVRLTPQASFVDSEKGQLLTFQFKFLEYMNE